jgi:hypothetical protein
MTPDEALAYRERWATVEAFEIAELRASTMDAKLRQLSALMASRDLFAADPEREHGTLQVRERWALLRKALGG